MAVALGIGEEGMLLGDRARRKEQRGGDVKGSCVKKLCPWREIGGKFHDDEGKMNGSGGMSVLGSTGVGTFSFCQGYLLVWTKRVLENQKPTP